MRGVWAVIKREYLQRVRSRWFVLTTLLAPVLFLALMAVPAWMESRGEELERRLVLVDGTGVLADRLTPALEDSGYEVERVADPPPAEDELRRRVAEEEVGAVLVVGQETLDRGAARWIGSNRPSTLRAMALRQSIVRAALEARLDGQGVDAGALLGGGSIQVEVLGEDGQGFQDPAFVTVYMGTFLLYMVILLYAVAVMRSVLEEKTNRIVEVVISSIRPWHLMLGKILGVGAVGLTQLAVWVGIGILAFVLGLPALLAARPELTEMAGLRDFLPGAGWLGLFLVFFLGGYFMYSALYAAVGAMCNSDQEAQQAQTPVVLLLVIPVIFVPGVMQSPSSTLSTSLSLVPFFSPILMFARSALGAAPAWQVALSVVLVGLTVVAVAWLAGRIYRTGILMAGKRPTLPELVRWVREA